MSTPSKKFINSAEQVVQESLKGLAIKNKDIIELVYQNKVNETEIPTVALNRKDLAKATVKLVCGGGSGHEPAHAGFVCEQILHAAVCGRVFASPSVRQVKHALEHIIQNTKDREVLVIIKNQTGDLLNFKSAANMVQAQHAHLGVKVRTLDVGDDVALLDAQVGVKPRGVAGTVLLYKILGGASVAGKNLDWIYTLGQEVLGSMGTMGVSMGSCSLPGQASSHSLGPEEIEVGMGIHGEKGREVTKWEQCSQVVEKILANLQKLPAISEGLKDPKSEWVVLINNLGSVTHLEMALVVNQFLTTFKGKCVRLVEGTLMSSLDMNGISISLLKVDSNRRQEILGQIDLKVDSPSWPKVVNLEDTDFRFNLVELNKDAGASTVNQSLNDIESTRKFRAGVKKLLEEMTGQEAEFNKLDGDVGDGDMGTGAAVAAKALLANLNSQDFQNNFSTSLIHLSEDFADSFGGTSGPLWGAFISEAATKLQAKLGDNKPKDWVNAYNAGLQALMKIGEAKKGERTIVDALSEGEEYLSKSGGDLAGLAKATRSGADVAKTMLATKGRSAYLGDKVKGMPDPGCEFVAFICQVISQNF